MAIPRTRDDLVAQINASYEKLTNELDNLGEAYQHRLCVDDWTVRDLLAVRVWWTDSVVEWIRLGREGETPVTPAPGFNWSETPRLNAEIIRALGDQSFQELRDRLDAGVSDALATIAELDDSQLLESGVYAWAGKWPIARWLSINTVRQYTTARSYVRRVIRETNA